MAGHRDWLSAVLCGSLGLSACDLPEVTLADPSAETAQRWVTIDVHLEDSALAVALGWEDGVPDAEVFITRVGDRFAPRTGLTDSTGAVRFESVVAGQYRIAAHRVLTGEEAAHTSGVVRAFGDGLKEWLSPTSVLKLSLRIDQAGSVVFSEAYPVVTTFADKYQWYQYFELYNNGGTTVFLDGMLWGWGWKTDSDYPLYGCAQTEAWRNDSLGLWVAHMHQFPGGGTDYPLAPGQTVTVALDAVDHSIVNPKYPDLTHADFELSGEADADNPDVPNLQQVGPTPWYRGHGLDLLAGPPWFLALATDPASLVQRRDPFWFLDWVRVPTSSLLDVVTASLMVPHMERMNAPCATSVARSLDRLEAAVPSIGSDTNTSMHRRVLRTTPDGRVILQDVNTSFVDFVEGRQSPGRIQPWPVLGGLRNHPHAEGPAGLQILRQPTTTLAQLARSRRRYLSRHWQQSLFVRQSPP